MTHAFRQLVRDELTTWVSAQKELSAILCNHLAEVLSPAAAEEIERRLLVRLGTIAPDERAYLKDVLSEVDQTLLLLTWNERVPETTLNKLRERVKVAVKALDELRPAPAGHTNNQDPTF